MKKYKACPHCGRLMRLARIYDWVGYVHAGGHNASAACARTRERAEQMKAQREADRRWVEESRAKRLGGGQ